MSKPKYITDDGKIIYLVMFEGKVQQVSFRYTSNKAATLLGLSGYVKNMEDGEVELLLKGYIDDIKECIFQLQDEFEIRNMRAERLEIDLWESNSVHEVHYEGGKKAVYAPVDYSKFDKQDYNRLSQEDIDYLNGLD